jgi:hypothetical protein
MKYGIREICDVVLKAKSKMLVGNKVFYKDEPVIYFDSLKTSTMEGAATTVYAQGGRGNSRLVAWEGERTVTFTMEDALISTVGLAILTGADVIQDTELLSPVHVTETIEYDNANNGWYVTKKPYQNGNEHLIYGMLLDDSGNPSTEPYIFKFAGGDGQIINGTRSYKIVEADMTTDGQTSYAAALPQSGVMLIDYYYETAKCTQIEITPDKFGGNFYLEASTLFRDTNGVDLPAEFIIPNCKVQSNFTFSMASAGDPSTFTFTMDAFPDYTRFNRTKKVLSAIQIVEEDTANAYHRVRTDASNAHRDGEDVVDSNAILKPVAEAAMIRATKISFAPGEETTYDLQTYPVNATYDLRIKYKTAEGTEGTYDSAKFKVENGVISATGDDSVGTYTIEIYDQADDSDTTPTVEGKLLDSINIEIVKNAKPA